MPIKAKQDANPGSVVKRIVLSGYERGML